MLIAPKSGVELRDDVQDFARDSFEQGRERLQPAIDQAREKLEPAVNQVRGRVAPVANDVREHIDSLTTQASSVADRVVENAGDLKERFANGNLLSVINEWTHDRLIAIDGIGPVLAQKIIQHRPYRSEQEFIDLKELPPSAIENLRKAA